MTKPEADAYNKRQMDVSNKLAHDLDRYIRNYRTQDRKDLTTGEVIVALGFLLGQRLKNVDKLQRWITEITIAGINAAKGSQ